jgi:hypothetical protein
MTQGKAMAEEQRSYEFTAVEAKDILAERQAFWESFTQGIVWAVAVTVVVLVGLVVFVA